MNGHTLFDLDNHAALLCCWREVVPPPDFLCFPCPRLGRQGSRECPGHLDAENYPGLRNSLRHSAVPIVSVTFLSFFIFWQQTVQLYKGL